MDSNANLRQTFLTSPAHSLVSTIARHQERHEIPGGCERLLEASKEPHPCIEAEFWSTKETIKWVDDTLTQLINDNNRNNRNRNYNNIGFDRNDLAAALEIFIQYQLCGKHLKEFVIEPNAFKTAAKEWSDNGGIKMQIISQFHIAVLQLFVTFVVIDLINDFSNVYRFTWKDITKQSTQTWQRCENLATQLNCLQKAQHHHLGYPSLTRQDQSQLPQSQAQLAMQQNINMNVASNYAASSMYKLGDLYYYGLWVIKDINDGYDLENQFLIICSHMEIASSIVELFDYERFASASIFNSGKQRVHASKIAPSFENDTFQAFVEKNISQSFLRANNPIPNRANNSGNKNNNNNNNNDNNNSNNSKNKPQNNDGDNESIELFADSMANGWCVMPFDTMKEAMIVCDTLDNHCEFAYPRLPMKCNLMARVYFRLVPSKWRIEDILTERAKYKRKQSVKTNVNLLIQDEKKSENERKTEDDSDNAGIAGIGGIADDVATDFDSERKQGYKRWKEQFQKRLLSLDPSWNWGMGMKWMMQFHYNSANTQFAEYFGFLWFRSQFEAERTIKYLNHMAFDSTYRCVAQLTIDTTCSVYLPIKNTHIISSEEKDDINNNNNNNDVNIRVRTNSVSENESNSNNLYAFSLHSMTIHRQINPLVNQVFEQLTQKMADCGMKYNEYIIVESKRLLKYENYGYLTFHCWNKRRACEVKTLLQSIVDESDTLRDNPEISEESNDLKTFQVIRRFYKLLFVYRLFCFLIGPLACFDNWLLNKCYNIENNGNSNDTMANNGRRDRKARLKPFFKSWQVFFFWVILITLWVPAFFNSTKYTRDSNLSYIEVWMPRIFSIFLILFYVATDAYDPRMIYPSKHTLLHLNMSLQCSNTVAPTVKSAFRLLSENDILKCPRPYKSAIHFDKKLRCKSILQHLLFLFLSFTLPALGALPRVINNSGTHGEKEAKHVWCENDWSTMKCFVVTYDDCMLVICTYFILHVFNTILFRTQKYFKDVTYLTDLIIDREFSDGTVGSSNIFKECCPICFGNNPQFQQYTSFLPLNNEQNQLAWYACRSYIKRKGGIILATLEMHILLLICFLFFFIIALLFSIFFGVDFSGKRGSNQEYYNNPAILGDCFCILLAMVFGVLIFFKGKRFEDINTKQLSRLQRQLSHLFKEKLSISTLYSNKLLGMKGANIAGTMHNRSSHRLSDVENISDMDSSAIEAQNIVDSLERIIDDCRNLDLCPLFLGQKLNRVGWEIMGALFSSIILAVSSKIVSEHFLHDA